RTVRRTFASLSLPNQKAQNARRNLVAWPEGRYAVAKASCSKASSLNPEATCRALLTHRSKVKINDLCEDGLQEHAELAAHGLPDEGRSRRARAAAAGKVAEQPPLRTHPGRPCQCRQIRSARWPTVREWRSAHRHSAQQNSQ